MSEFSHIFGIKSYIIVCYDRYRIDKILFLAKLKIRLPVRYNINVETPSLFKNYK